MLYLLRWLCVGAAVGVSQAARFSDQLVPAMVSITRRCQVTILSGFDSQLFATAGGAAVRKALPASCPVPL